MKKSNQNKYSFSARATAKHRKEIKRLAKKQRLHSGKVKFLNDARLTAIKKNGLVRKTKKAKLKNRQNPFKQFIDQEVPILFNLEYENCIPVIKFINELKNTGSKGYNINILMDNVIEIGDGAIAMLLSVITELGENGIIIKGTIPINAVVNSILQKSGFFRYVKTILSIDESKTRNKILTGDNKTSMKEVVVELRKSMETIWGVNARCPRLFGGIIEMVRNTCDHAFRKKEGIKWHLALSHNEANNQVKFSFADNGKGIIRTFGSTHLQHFFKLFRDNTDMLTTAFTDGIESRTGLSWRGKGLPTIFELSSDHIISRLVVISNDVYIDFDKDIKVTLPVSYSGTYYYWEVDTNCVKSYFE